MTYLDSYLPFTLFNIELKNIKNGDTVCRTVQTIEVGMKRHL